MMITTAPSGAASLSNFGKGTDFSKDAPKKKAIAERSKFALEGKHQTEDMDYKAVVKQTVSTET